MDAIKIANASKLAIAALANEPLSPAEMVAVLRNAAMAVEQAHGADFAVQVEQEILGKIRRVAQ